MNASERQTSPVACLECGQPVVDGGGWLCSPRCAAVMALVRHGRSPRDLPDPDQLNRLRRAGGIVGHFPTEQVQASVRSRDRHRCRYAGCGAAGERLDWVTDDPDLRRRVRSGDLRTLCDQHHFEESRRRFVGPHGEICHTAPVTWARIEASEPLVLRDNPDLWADERALRLLRSWPLADRRTRRDVALFISAVARTPSDASDRLNAALDALNLPSRRRERLVRAIAAVLQAIQADEGTSDSVSGDPGGPTAASSAG